MFHKKAKVTKKISLRLTCDECRRVWMRCIGRTKTFVSSIPAYSFCCFSLRLMQEHS